ncbi:leucine-rich repeat-containing protein 74B-like [Mytilus trossulus]|uniref:leucine-rich repeat-containing protein 74B-like n=1 Tax=Mytilus trossulus TaxID=6551 RepID=UPI00300410EC
MDVLPTTRFPEINTVRSKQSSPENCIVKLPNVEDKTNYISSDDEPVSSPCSRPRRRRKKSNSGTSSARKSARADSRSQHIHVSPLSELKPLNLLDNTQIISDDLYNEKKERLIKCSKLKDELRVYFNIDAKLGIIKTEDSEDDAYDTDLDQDRVGLELIVDEKTKQIKDFGEFPEYKKRCRDLKVVPNTFLIRHATEDNFKMRHRYMTSSDCRTISKEVEHNLAFQSIDLEDNGITHKHLQTMADMLLKNNSIIEFNISNNPIGPEGAKILKYILANNYHVVKADVSDCGLGEKSGPYLAEIIENNVFLRELYLRRNNLGNAAAKYIGDALGSNITLELLDISWNQIGKQGAIALAAGLKVNTQLEILNVAMNGFGEDGGIALFEALKNQDSLEELDITANRLTDKVARVISTIIPYNRHLKTLKISYNHISSVGALTLLKPYSSRMKKRLATVELQGIDVDAELIDAVNTLQNKRGMTVLISRPPSRREKTSDQLTYSLIKIVELMKDFEVDVYDLFPGYEKEREEMITTDEIIAAMKECERIPEKKKIQSVKRLIRDTRNRNFQLKEFAVLYTQVNRGSDPSIEEPLRSVFAGRKRALTPASVQKKKEETKSSGVRFF